MMSVNHIKSTIPDGGDLFRKYTFILNADPCIKDRFMQLVYYNQVVSADASGGHSFTFFCEIDKKKTTLVNLFC